MVALEMKKLDIAKEIELGSSHFNFFGIEKKINFAALYLSFILIQ
jgi:hypothetical protein